ncbi:MAG: RelA/SpoT domain-containing protein [Oscillospiraceae bacterium]|nr:RelA/SpoT domain-containing protein [Oscillospiraceae bacterium]
MDKTAFFEKYGIDEKEFEKLGMNWDDLMVILEEYSSRLPMYEDTARFLADLMNKEKSIHSIKYRVKDKEHLIEKIIRKSAQEPAFLATFKDYEKNVKDLIGLRALHLFKENWVEVHRFLAENWDFYTAPRANYKKGDPESLLSKYAEMGCELNEHRHGYRSIHYHLLIKLGRQDMVAEVQVRTLFEEAWSEIDHYFRYSFKRETEQAEPYLGVLNNITSNADALASYINNMGIPGNGGEAEPQGRSQLNVREIYSKVRNG